MFSVDEIDLSNFSSLYEKSGSVFQEIVEIDGANIHVLDGPYLTLDVVSPALYSPMFYEEDGKPKLANNRFLTGKFTRGALKGVSFMYSGSYSLLLESPNEVWQDKTNEFSRLWVKVSDKVLLVYMRESAYRVEVVEEYVFQTAQLNAGMSSKSSEEDLEFSQEEVSLGSADFFGKLRNSAIEVQETESSLEKVVILGDIKLTITNTDSLVAKIKLTNPDQIEYVLSEDGSIATTQSGELLARFTFGYLKGLVFKFSKGLQLSWTDNKNRVRVSDEGTYMVALGEGRVMTVMAPNSFEPIVVSVD